jgi:hypothetical protein
MAQFLPVLVFETGKWTRVWCHDEAIQVRAKIVTSFLLIPVVRGSYIFFLVTVLVALTGFQLLFFFFITKVSPNEDFEPLYDVTVIIIRE